VIWHVYADGGMLSGVDETQNGVHHLVQRHRCPDLVIGHPAQQRLNRLDVIKDPAEFLRCLAERVTGPVCQPLNKRLNRRAQQNNMIELRMELHLVLLAASDEQDVRVLGGQQCLDGVLPPYLTAVRQTLAPPIVSVDCFVPASGQGAHNG
jgi:hypothetical protein